jgi:hypothetical protein
MYTLPNSFACRTLVNKADPSLPCTKTKTRYQSLHYVHRNKTGQSGGRCGILLRVGFRRSVVPPAPGCRIGSWPDSSSKGSGGERWPLACRAIEHQGISSELQAQARTHTHTHTHGLSFGKLELCSFGAVFVAGLPNRHATSQLPKYSTRSPKLTGLAALGEGSG